jgi:hypothetical protein
VQLSTTSYTLSVSGQGGTAGAHQTVAARVTLVGQTDPNVSVTLLETGATTVSSNTGTFQFPDVMLARGGNPFPAALDSAVGAGTIGSNALQVPCLAT